MSDQRWNFSGIEQKVAALKAEQRAIAASLDEERALLPEIGEFWVGSGQQAWNAQQSGWQQRADDLNAALQDLIDTAEAAGGHMRSVESTVGGWFGQA